MPPLNVDLENLIAQIDEDLSDRDDLAKIGEARQRANALAGIGDKLIDHFVTRARATGTPWSQIGGALGVSKQAAQQRWMGSPFSRFTDPAKRAVVLAQQRASGLRHGVIGPEHILIGLLEVKSGLAARAVANLAGERETVAAIVKTMIPGTSTSPTHIPFSPECKEAMVHALEEALQLGHNHIGTEHLLLGLLKLPQSRVVAMLSGLGVGYDDARAQIQGLLGDGDAQP